MIFSDVMKKHGVTYIENADLNKNKPIIAELVGDNIMTVYDDDNKTIKVCQNIGLPLGYYMYKNVDSKEIYIVDDENNIVLAFEQE